LIARSVIDSSFSKEAVNGNITKSKKKTYFQGLQNLLSCPYGEFTDEGDIFLLKNTFTARMACKTSTNEQKSQKQSSSERCPPAP